MNPKPLHVDETCQKLEQAYENLVAKYTIKQDSRFSFWRWVLRKVFRI